MRALSGLLFLLVCTFDSEAHQIGVSAGTYTPTTTGAEVEWLFATRELAEVAPALDRDSDGDLSADEVAEQSAPIWELLAPTLAQADCALTKPTIDRLDQDGLRIGFAIACPQAGPITLHLRSLEHLRLGHRHLAGVGPDARFILSERSPELRIDALAAAPAPGLGAMFLSGIEHILIGFDHIAFLLGLILLPMTWSRMLIMVSAFTLGHSLSLALAVLANITLSPALVEPLIAASVIYVALDNLLGKDSGRRWLLCLPFGLLHGFGFAGALGEVSAQGTTLALSLLNFNLGIEAGQLALIAIILPLTAVLRRLDRYRESAGRRRTPWFPAANLALIAVGAFWLVDRLS